MKTVIISQARMTSTRLPGKVLKEVLGKSLLAYQIERLYRVNYSDQVIIATSSNDTDDPIEELCVRLGVTCFRGSEEDVLSRFYHAATETQADVVVRVTSDCPLIDPAVVDRVISSYTETVCDYASNTLVRSYPRGMDTEVFSYRCLAEAHREAKEYFEREHVTPFIYTRPDFYKILGVEANEDNSKYRWTVDTSEDFELINKIIEFVYPLNNRFSMHDCLRAYAEHPCWMEINGHVEQKELR